MIFGPGRRKGEVTGMKKQYWETFTQTGRVEDYLFYKGIERCQNIMVKYEETESESVSNSDRDGDFGNTDWRI